MTHPRTSAMARHVTNEIVEMQASLSKIGSEASRFARALDDTDDCASDYLYGAVYELKKANASLAKALVEIQKPKEPS